MMRTARARCSLVCMLGLATSVFTAAPAHASFTIATFADPATIAATPLFTLDITPGSEMLTGGWSDAMTGLTLQVPFTSNTYVDAYFTMTDVPLVPVLPGQVYLATPGTIRFFADGQDPLSQPLFQIDFTTALVTTIGFGAFNDSPPAVPVVIFSGSEIGAAILEDESFAFAFANQVSTTPATVTATAAFTSSAIPEPLTLLLLGLTLPLLRRRRA